MTDYKKYLKAALVGDGKIITYRQLARELKIHVNVAKEMLYDFHHDLNLCKPSSCHATYILSGLRRTLDSSSQPPTSGGTKDAEGDEVMGSIPLELSQVSSVGEGSGKDGGGRAGGRSKGSVRSIVLVGEERLEEVKASFEVLSAIHVYSIEPSPLSDMLLLADNSLAVMRLDVAEKSPQDIAKKYGSIMNPHAKRRTGPQPAAAAPVEDKKSIFGKKTASVTPSASTSTPAANTTTTTAQGKRAKADFFKAFGGAVAKKKENKKADDSSSLASTVASAKPKPEKSPPPTKRTTVSTPQLKKEDSKMDIDGPEESEQEEDEEEVMRPSEEEDELTPVVKSEPAEDSEEEEEGPNLSPPLSMKRTTAANAQRKAENSAKLRAMMDDSDDEDVPTLGQQQHTTTPPTANPGDDEVPPSGQKPLSPIIADTSTPVRRRRARRKVNKRTMTRDKDGFLVTQNEMAWESYSEDEPEAPPQVVKKEKPIAIPREKKEDGEAEKGKKKAPAKKGAQQGNIMSFFGRK
ncbi:DNA polymerase subunit Cdc27 [Tirmania nivea]|nr:DNA polymerase subunit Cdc27 [Tirmania nivea]